MESVLETLFCPRSETGKDHDKYKNSSVPDPDWIRISTESISPATDPDPGQPKWSQKGENEEISRSKNSLEGWRFLLNPERPLKQCCGSVFGIRCLFDPWIRDPGWVKNQDPDPG